MLVSISPRRSPRLHPITNTVALVRSAGASLPVRPFQSSRAFPVFRTASTPQPFPLVRRCPPSNSFRVPSAPKTFLARSLVGPSASSSFFTSSSLVSRSPSLDSAPAIYHRDPRGSAPRLLFPLRLPRRPLCLTSTSLVAPSQWRRGNGDELIKLVETTRTLTPVHFATSSPTYLNNVVKEKWSPPALLRSGDHRDLASNVDRRVRGTAGGDRLAALPYSVSTATASHPTLNCLLNSVVSDHAFFGSIDLTDFYLGTHNPSPQFLKIYLADYPSSVVARLRLQPFLKLDRHGKSFVILRIDKTLYGLKEAGKLSNLRLVQLL